MFKYYGGAVHLEQEYEHSNALTSRPTFIVDNMEWQVEFNKLAFSSKKSIPKPGIYQGRPCFYGGFNPIKSPKMLMSEIIIFNSKFEYEIVCADEVNVPTNEQYKKYFKNIVTSGIVSIATMNPQTNNSRYPRSFNNLEYIFIQIGKKRYRWFDGYIRPWEPFFKTCEKSVKFFENGGI